MKRLFLLAVLGLATTTALPVSAADFSPKVAPKDDTILVKLANGAKMSLVVKNTEQLKSFQNYSLDSLMVMLNKYISEAEKMEKKDVNGKDYTVSFRPAEETKDKRRPEKISITMKGLEKDEKGETKLSQLNIDVEYEEKEKDKATVKSTLIEADSLKKAKNANRRHQSGLNFDLGFNTLLNDGGTDLDKAGLKPWGSRYVSLNPYYQVRIGGKRSPLHLRTGVDFAFNNYMFDHNYVLLEEETNGQSETVLRKSERNLEKSKLATSSANLPLMVVLNFKDKKGHSSFRFGAGGFVGYRLGSHTKIKYNLEGDTKKDKDQGNFNLEELQYGLKATIGYRGFDLFANYNLNELFKDGRGPKANVLSFGITI
ncbi:PorT family protein [Adhaeribacter sp. BT258]|uniref:PorT family protein n=1 Tax=Adhaeribacter terrigena TaxID=2793070 RepID=A0ABS1C301_9BACT|nr:outer membrane beta-barrel protein [Adhaeribacter terrigena]MBK0402935.1 PorT family protein [Adhaeribacter terrigena]